MADQPIEIQIGNEVLLFHRQVSTSSGYTLVGNHPSASTVKPAQKTITFMNSSIPALSLNVPVTTTAGNKFSGGPSVKIKSKSPVKKKVTKIPPVPKQLPPVALPQSRIRVIMKTAPNISFLSQEAVALAAKAAELFIKKLARDVHQESLHQQSSSTNEIQYGNIARTVRNSTSFAFLKDFLPNKMTVQEYQRLTSSNSSSDVPFSQPLTPNNETNTSDKKNSNLNIT